MTTFKRSVQRRQQISFLLTKEFLVAERTIELVVVFVERGGCQLLLAVAALEAGQMEGGPVCCHVGLSGEHRLLLGSCLWSTWLSGNVTNKLIVLNGPSASLLMRNNSWQVGHFGGGGGADQGMTLSCWDWRRARRNYWLLTLCSAISGCGPTNSFVALLSITHLTLIGRDAVFRVTKEIFHILMILYW